MSTDNKSGMTIGQAAQAVGVAATTLRYYEREGILAPTVRSRSGYRLYDDHAVARLHFIRSAQAVGFTLDDIRALLRLGDDTSCHDVRRLIEHRLADVDRKLADLQRVRETLAGALERCRASKTGCAVVADLKKAPRKHVDRGDQDNENLETGIHSGARDRGVDRMGRNRLRPVED